MSSDIPIVQGVAVTDLSSKDPSQTSYHNATYDASGGYAPPPLQHSLAPAQPLDAQQLSDLRAQPIQQFQDVIWAVVFGIHLVVMFFVLVFGLSNTGGLNSKINSNIGFLTFVTGLTALGLSTAALSFMMQHTEVLVQTALVFSVLTSLAVGLLGFMMGNMMMGGLGMLSFAIGCCYAKIVWPRIPFAAANLKTAVSAVQVNMGLMVISLGLTVIAGIWALFWFMGAGAFLEGEASPVIFLLFLSFYWVHQVLQNTMHVCTAGVVGTWWWVPSEATSFWSKALTDSFIRATTYSFGSVCFGSFLVSIVQALRALEHHTRNNRDMQLLSCIIQCILSCIQGMIEFLNRWAYVYVGLYGFSYLEAGRNVVQLFQAKGWTAIIADDLADNVLFMISVAIGLASGLVGLMVGFLDSDMFEDLGFQHASGPAFFVGFLAGFLFASVLLSVVGSAVNTVIVAYAEDPATFQLNHPVLSGEMRSAWVAAWPDLVH